MPPTIALGLVGLLLVTISGTALAASGVSRYDSSYAVEGTSWGGGSVVYKTGSGKPNFLRATAHGDIVQFVAPYLALVSIRQGTISGARVRYTGMTGGRLDWVVTGSFARTESGGVGFGVGTQIQHRIVLQLIDVTTSKIVAVGPAFALADVTVDCGWLVYPVGVGGCDNTTSDTFPSLATGHFSGLAIRYGNSCTIRVYVATTIAAEGFGLGLDGTTTAQSLSATFSWK